MEVLFLLLVGAAGFILIGSIMGFTASSRITRLEREVKSLRSLISARDNTPFSSNPSFKDLPLDQPRAAAATQKVITKVEAPPPAPPKDPAPQQKNNAPVKSKMRDVKPLKSPKPKQSLEEMIGAQWSVWVGGLALFLGAVFLLRYTIEAGVFTPAMRIIMAFLFGAALLSGGEFLRRADRKIGGTSAIARSLTEYAYIPGVLTAVGIFALLGAVYAAYELYGFIGAPLAFIMMGAISLGALALGLLHGPKLAALGLAASLVTPLLIQDTEPNAYILYGYLTIVSTAALALARKRDWGWLNIFTLLGAMFWIFFSLGAAKAIGTHMAWLGFTALMFAVSTFIASGTLITRATANQAKADKASLVYGPKIAVFWALLAALAVFITVADNDAARLHYWTGWGFTAVLMATACLRPRQSGHILTAGLLGVALVLMALDAEFPWTEIIITAGLLSAAFIAMCYTRLFVKLEPSENRKPSEIHQRDMLWASASVLLPIGLFFLLGPIYETASPKIISAIFLALTLTFMGLAYLLWRKKPGRDIPASVYALGAALAYLVALFIGLGQRGETLALTLGILIAALAATKVTLKTNRMIAAGFGLLTAAHVIWVQIPDAAAVSKTITFNELWIYLALPAIVCTVASYLLSRPSKDLWSEGLKALALSFAALFIVFQIRHFMNGGDILAERLSFDELALQVLTGLSFTLGGTLIGPQKLDFKAPIQDRFIPMLAMGISLLTFLIFAFGVCFSKAPIFNSYDSINGGVLFNSLLLAYLLPAILLAAISWTSKSRRPLTYVKLTAALALFSFMLYVTSMIRKGFQGAEISIFKTPPIDVELYTISAVWLLIGIAMLVLGLKGKRQDVRLASGLIIVLTVLKAFLIDMASLEGVLRAMSFVVLGVVLIVIGRVYQRLLFSEKTTQ
ncbi:MAG: DUF2339 domain-containing protein [Hellea sp.]